MGMGSAGSSSPRGAVTAHHSLHQVVQQFQQFPEWSAPSARMARGREGSFQHQLRYPLPSTRHSLTLAHPLESRTLRCPLLRTTGRSNISGLYGGNRRLHIQWF